MESWQTILLFACLAGGDQPTAADEHPLASLERSFWLHASLAPAAQRGYWGTGFPACLPPSDSDVQEAVRLLNGCYAANRLYLVYHHEISVEQAERAFASWRRHCPETTQLVPALLLRMYDQARTEVFAQQELTRLVSFCQNTLRMRHMAVYDVIPGRDRGKSFDFLAKQYPEGLIRVGIQPQEKIEPPVVIAVQDTWSGLCHGKTNVDWAARGFGAETLAHWVERRNEERRPVAWDLVVVAWDYSATERGGYPGYDDANKNMPLPAGRNVLAAETILRMARIGCLAGFSSDLLIVQANSQSGAHDGREASFYASLKQGKEYRGYYSQPLQEIGSIYKRLREGKPPR